jgi:hypothetical protein
MTLQPFLGELRLSQVVFMAPTSAAPDNTLSQNRLNCHRLEEQERVREALRPCFYGPTSFEITT